MDKKNVKTLDDRRFLLYFCSAEKNAGGGLRGCTLWHAPPQNEEIMEMKDPIEEARRYVANAEEVIKKANYDPELKIYTDSKYIKTAGNILWCGCLVALDALLDIRDGKGRPSIAKYKEAAGKRDRKLLAFIVGGYDTMHLFMGYDGSKDKKVCDAGFEKANDIINRCALLLPKPAYA